MPRRLPSATPGLALLPLRLFLGVTFVYAGYQKLSDPGFLTPGASTYIGTQLHGFAAGTPGGFLLRRFALPYPRAAGIGVALAEIAIGLLATAGMLTRPAAAAGLGLNLVLFLTASWHTTPYFLGSDVVFCFAWLPFVPAGAAGQPAVDSLWLAERRTGERSPGRTRSGAHIYAAGAEGPHTRSVHLRRGLAAAAAATASIAGLAAATRGDARSAAPPRALPAGTGPATTHRRRRRARASADAGGGPRVPAGAVRLGPASGLKAGAAAVYRDPADGSPDIVVRRQDGSLAAFSAVCTHAGCQVEYGSGVLLCPCHGSEFDATTGAVLQGPAVAPLARKRVIQRGGSIYAV
jgi:thiosulfate dehydrogenase (quinone) large subunit